MIGKKETVKTAKTATRTSLEQIQTSDEYPCDRGSPAAIIINKCQFIIHKSSKSAITNILMVVMLVVALLTVPPGPLKAAESELLQHGFLASFPIELRHPS